MNANPRPVWKALWLLALTCAVPAPCASVAQSAAVSPQGPDGIDPKVVSQLLSSLQKSAGANAELKRYADMLAASLPTALAQGQYDEVERSLLQTKVAFSASRDSVGILEELIAKVESAGQAAKARRASEADAIVRELADRFNSRAPAQDFDPLLRRISAFTPTPYAQDPASAELEGAREFITHWQDYLVQSSQGKQREAENSLQALVQLAARFTAVPRSALMTLQSNPPANEAAAAMDRQEKARVDSMVAKAVAAIDSAKTAADLDPLVAELAAAPLEGNGGNYPGGGVLPSTRRLDNVKIFVREWQEYLAAAHSGKPTDAMRILQDLANPRYDASFYPRSKVLELMQHPVSAAAGPLIAPDALTIDNLREFYRQLIGLNGTSYLADHGEPQLEQVVSQLCTALGQVRAGNPANAVSNARNSVVGFYQAGDYTGAVARVTDEIVLLALPPYIEAPAEFAPLPTESAKSYLDRVLKGAVASKNWELAYRAVLARGELSSRMGGSADTMADTEVLRDMILATNQEAAQQWADCTTSYLNALRALSTLVPAKEIGDRLERIKAEHPEDYESGKKQAEYHGVPYRVASPTIRQPRPGELGSPRSGANPVPPEAPAARVTPTPTN